MMYAVVSPILPRDIIAIIMDAVSKASSKAAIVDSLFLEREMAIKKTGTFA